MDSIIDYLSWEKIFIVTILVSFIFMFRNITLLIGLGDSIKNLTKNLKSSNDYSKNQKDEYVKNIETFSKDISDKIDNIVQFMDLDNKKKLSEFRENGTHREWYDNGHLKKELCYKNGRLIKESSFNYRGVKSEEKKYDNENVSIKKWYDNGKLNEEDILALGGSQKNGIWKSYYYHGQLEEEGNYVNGYKNGIWKSYYSDGQLASEINYLEGRRNGTHREWFNNGKFKKIYDSLDSLFDDAATLVIKQKKVSFDMLQKEFKLGNNRASRLLEDCEYSGLIVYNKEIRDWEVLIKDEKELNKFIKTLKSREINFT